VILDYTYSTLQQFPLYQGMGNAWTFNGLVDIPIVVDPPDQGEKGVEFRTETNRLHFRTETNRAHFRPEVIR
jgi:hypothetical protein